MGALRVCGALGQAACSMRRLRCCAGALGRVWRGAAWRSQRSLRSSPHLWQQVGPGGQRLADLHKGRPQIRQQLAQLARPAAHSTAACVRACVPGARAFRRGRRQLGLWAVPAWLQQAGWWLGCPHACAVLRAACNAPLLAHLSAARASTWPSATSCATRAMKPPRDAAMRAARAATCARSGHTRAQPHADRVHAALLVRPRLLPPKLLPSSCCNRCLRAHTHTHMHTRARASPVASGC